MRSVLSFEFIFWFIRVLTQLVVLSTESGINQCDAIAELILSVFFSNPEAGKIHANMSTFESKIQQLGHLFYFNSQIS